MEAVLFVIAFGLLIAAAAIIFRQHGLEPLGFYKINDFTVEKIRQAVITACNQVSVAGLSREKAQHHLAEIARHAIAAKFAEIYKGKAFKVTPSWPQATCIISGNIAVFDLWIGQDFMDDGEGVRPVNIEVNRLPTKTLSKARPIKVELETMFAPPPKAAAIQPAAEARPEPRRRTLPSQKKG